MSKPCACDIVKPYDGVWRCMVCWKVFVPADSIEFADEQLPYIPARGIENPQGESNVDPGQTG